MNQASDRNTVDALIGRRVREAREATGLTQVQLGALLGCSYNKIHNIEGGIVRATVTDVIDIARHLDLSPLFFLQDVIGESNMLRFFRDLVDRRGRFAVEVAVAVQRFSRLDEQIAAIQEAVSRKGSEQ
jgi:transcriptional regulator with XRE-family HTH domain